MSGITVGIATRDGAKYLPFCLRSLIAQTVKPDEYVICIGPSSDKTEEIILDFVKNTDVPTKIIYDKDGIGTGYARKAIIENSTQEYVAVADSDYIFPSNWIDILIKIIEKDDFDCFGFSVACNIIKLSMAMKMRKNDKLPELIATSILEQTSKRIPTIKVVKCKSAIEVGNYDPYFSRGQGQDLYIRLDKQGYKIVGYTGMNVFHVRDGTSLKKNLSSGVFLKFLYKYGLDYIFLSNVTIKHTIAFLLRSCVVFSFLFFGVSLITDISPLIPILMFLTGASGLMGGLILARSTTSVSLRSIINQFSKCFGEYYLLYQLLITSNKPKRGYGKKHIQRGKQR